MPKFFEPNNALSHNDGDSKAHDDWDRLLADAAPRDHVVQLYQDQDFLNRAVCRFAAAALANGEGIILVPTVRHWNAFRPRLIAEGIDVEAAQKRGQLTIVDADETLPRFMHNGMPDSPVFLGLAADVVTRARGGSRFPKVRWWGEMVNILWERGDVAASMNLEDLFDQLAHKHDIAIFCSFLMDNFNGEIHSRLLPRLGRIILISFQSMIMRGWNEPWLTLCAILLDPTRPVSSKVICSRAIRRSSACHGRKRCYSHCVRFFRPFLTPSCSGVASCIQLT